MTVTAEHLTSGRGGAVHGVYFRDELAASGINDRERRRQLASDELESLRKDWFAVSGAHPTVKAAVKGGGVLSCVSALEYYGFWVPPWYQATHARRDRRHPRGTCRGYNRFKAGRTAVDSIIVALECASRCMSAEDWIVVCDSVQNTLGMSAAAVRAEMGSLPQRVLDLFEKTDCDSQSGTESFARVRLRALGFMVVVQPKIPEVGHSDLRVGRLIIECDGEAYHSDSAQFREDRRRDRKATISKLMTFRLTPDDVLYCWDEIVQDVRKVTKSDRHRIRAKDEE